MKTDLFLVVGYVENIHMNQWKEWFPLGTLCKKRLSKEGYRVVTGPFVCGTEIVMEAVTEDMIPTLKMIYPELDWRYLGYA